MMSNVRDSVGLEGDQHRGGYTVAWLGQDNDLLEHTWSLATVLHVRTGPALLHILEARMAVCVVFDSTLPDVDCLGLAAMIRDRWPHVGLMALIDTPPRAPITANICRYMDQCLSIHAPSSQLAEALQRLAAQMTQQVVEDAPDSVDSSAINTLQERLSHLEGLVQATFTMSRTTSQHDILGDLRNAVRIAVDADDMAIVLTDGDYVDLSDSLNMGTPGTFLSVCREHFHSLPEDQRQYYVADEVLLREVARNVPDLLPKEREAAAAGAESYMRLPLLIDQQLVGFIALFAELPNRFGGVHLQLARLFANQVAIAVRNMRLYLRLSEVERRQTTVSQVARLIAEHLELEPVLQHIVREAVGMIDGRSGMVLLRADDGGLVIRAVYNLPNDLLYRHAPARQGQAGYIADTGEPSIVTNYREWKHANEEMRASFPKDHVLYGVPLSYRGEVLGVLQVTGSNRAALRMDEAQEVLLMLAPQAATAIAKAQLHEIVEQDRRQLRAILDYTPAAVAVCDAQGRVEMVNPAASRVLAALNLPVNEVLDRTVGEVVAGLFDDPPSLQEFTELGQPFEVSLGAMGEYVLQIAAITNREGQVERYVGVAQDVSELSRADRMKSDMIGVLTHDMGNLLMLVRNPIDMLEDPTLAEEQRETLRQVLDKSLGRMEQLVHDVGALSQAEQEGHEAMEPFDIAAEVREIVERNQDAADAKQIALIYQEISAPEDVFNGHQVLISQAVDNLVSNAIKYTPEGGHVNVMLSVEGESVVVRVSDTGYGIPADKLPYVFDAFYRVKDRRTAHIPGTGLGLSLVKTIVERHGGTVDVESVVNMGSVFTLTLPLEVVSEQYSPARSVPRLDLSALGSPERSPEGEESAGAE